MNVLFGMNIDVILKFSIPCILYVSQHLVNYTNKMHNFELMHT